MAGWQLNAPLKVTGNLIRLERDGRLLLLNSLQPRPLLFRRGSEFVEALLASAACGLLSRDELVALFTAKEGERIDEAYVVYNEFVSVLAQKPTIKKLLPVDFKSYLPKQEEEDSGLGLDDESQGKIIEETVMEHSPDDIFDEEDQEEE